MKLAFLVLVLVNLLLFAWQQGVFGRHAERGREPERTERQIEPERIRVLTDKDLQALRERVAAGGVDLAAPQACVEYGDFLPGETARAEKALAALPAGVRTSARTVDAPGWYMVYVPPLKTRPEAERRAEELRRLGVRDLLVMGEASPMRFGISLGSFRDAETARGHLAELERLGVKGMRMTEKPATVAATRYQLRDLDADATRQLAALRSEFPAQSLRPCQGP